MKSQKAELRNQKSRGRGFSCFLLLASCFCLSTLNFAYTIEIPLEGFGKTTNIAYVNMHKIFEAFPETEKARVELNHLIEDKKLEITDKKEEIARLKVEIEGLRRQMAAVAPTTAPHIPASEPVLSAVNLQEGTTSAPSALTPLALPEGSPLGFIFSPPLKSTETPAVETSTRAIIAISTSAPQILPGIPSPEPQLKEKESLLSQKEADLEAFIGSAEEEVRRLEEGKTMTLLARIYKSLEEIAAKEGYSVIVDRETLLYGETAVDITQNVIWRLSAPFKKEK